MLNDPRILFIAFLGGLTPALLWLWFWVREEENKSEPKAVLTMVFIMGMVSVACVIPIQKFIQANTTGDNLQLILFAGAEEIIKIIAVLVILYKTKYIDEPIDWPIYLVTAALGFAALENTLYLIKPIGLGQDTISLLTGQFRFLGATLLHAVSSGIMGIALGISFHTSGFKKKIHALVGLILAISLHSVFNFFIIRVKTTDANYFLEIFKVFGFLWVVSIILMLLFEKIRRMN